MILLDTDVRVDILRQYPPAIAWLETLDDEGILLPGFVIMELIQGSRNKEEQEKLEKELKNYSVVWPSGAMCNEALSVFARHHLSHGIGVLDALIGQIAVARDVPLHTFNEKHYEAVPGLQTVQPYSKNV